MAAECDTQFDNILGLAILFRFQYPFGSRSRCLNCRIGAITDKTARQFPFAETRRDATEAVYFSACLDRFDYRLSGGSVYILFASSFGKDRGFRAWNTAIVFQAATGKGLFQMKRDLPRARNGTEHGQQLYRTPTGHWESEENHDRLNNMKVSSQARSLEFNNLAEREGFEPSIQVLARITV